MDEYVTPREMSLMQVRRGLSENIDLCGPAQLKLRSLVQTLNNLAPTRCVRIGWRALNGNMSLDWTMQPNEK